MDWVYWIIILVVSFICSFLYWFSAPYRASRSMFTKNLKYRMIDINNLETNPFERPGPDLKPSPIIEKPPRLYFTLVVPAFNEEKRIGKMLNEYIDYLKGRDKGFEIIVVDDGSKDNTSNLALQIGKERGIDLKVVKCPKNGGKGLAVKIGVLCSLGQYIIFADADNATKATCIGDLEEAVLDLDNKVNGAVAIGSRNHNKVGVVKERNWLRNFLSLASNKFLKFIFSTNINVFCIKDTQCGFKMFSRKAAFIIFRIQHLERWAFDLEIVLLIQRMNIPYKEVPVHWTEIEGSKFSAARDMIFMLRDACLVRCLYDFGFWTKEDILMY